MGLLSKFENKMEDGIEGAAGVVAQGSISPVQITKRAEKQMRRERIVGAGKQYAPTLYTVLVSVRDDAALGKYYPTLAGETETYLIAKAREAGYVMDGMPLVRFIADPDLKKGKFDVVAEMVTSSVIEQLRADEMERYGLSSGRKRGRPAPGGARVGDDARSAARASEAASRVPAPTPQSNLSDAEIEERVRSQFKRAKNDSAFDDAANLAARASAEREPSLMEVIASEPAVGDGEPSLDMNGMGVFEADGAAEAARREAVARAQAKAAADAEAARQAQAEAAARAQAKQRESVIVPALQDEPPVISAGSREISALEREQELYDQISQIEDVVRNARRAVREVAIDNEISQMAAGSAQALKPAIKMPAISENLPKKKKISGVDAIFGDSPDSRAASEYSNAYGEQYAVKKMRGAKTVDFDQRSSSGSVSGPLPEVYLYDERRDVAYQLSGRPQQIGRESSNEISIPDINISRTHAEISRDANGTWHIRDLNSTNGLFINGRKVAQAPLRDADMITMGTTTMEFQLLE